ncbi:MAG: hypothetical protein ABIJ31_07775, partial [Pseudomonadota bacterium]
MDRHLDIRDRKNLSGEEIKSLNFINGSGPYCFRKYYRSGLRSHIFEVLLVEDMHKETNGIIENGVRIFPRACPEKVFRIFRKRFATSEQIVQEIHKYNILLDVLGPDLIALSEEFMVEYTNAGGNTILLCGLQEYIKGEILDPWKIFGKTYIQDLHSLMPCHAATRENFVQTATKNIERFVTKIRQMIIENGYIPDLAGIGNLILTPDGTLKLVDINNIVQINYDKTVPIDDKGYPSCDVSVQVLHILEQKLLNTDLSAD